MILQQERQHQSRCRCCISHRFSVLRLIENNFDHKKRNQEPDRPVSRDEKGFQLLPEGRPRQPVSQEQHAEFQRGIEQGKQHIGDQESPYPLEVKITPFNLVLARPQSRAYPSPDEENGNVVAA